jgi:hypothetical protein
VEFYHGKRHGAFQVLHRIRIFAAPEQENPQKGRKNFFQNPFLLKTVSRDSFYFYRCFIIPEIYTTICKILPKMAVFPFLKIIPISGEKSKRKIQMAAAIFPEGEVFTGFRL